MKKIVPFLPLLCLYAMVLFAFKLQTFIPLNFHDLYLLTFLLLYIAFLFSTQAMMKCIFKTKKDTSLAGVIFVLLNTVGLFYLSSIHRAGEINRYLADHEKGLTDLIHQMKQTGENEKTGALLQENNIYSVSPSSGNYYLTLYRCLGYGYGLTFTDSIEMKKPVKSPGGSPLVKWMKIKEHWYYYSFFD